jgi:hypothetical protein
MTIKKLLVAVAAVAAASAWAQAPLGTITSVNGVATVTTGTTGTAITVGAPIMNGSRVITTSTGSVSFRLNNGCALTVPPGHAVTVLADRTCEQLRAAIQPVTTTVQTTTTASTVPVGPTFLPGAGATAAAAGLIALGLIASQIDDDDDEPLSAR